MTIYDDYDDVYTRRGGPESRARIFLFLFYRGSSSERSRLEGGETSSTLSFPDFLSGSPVPRDLRRADAIHQDLEFLRLKWSKTRRDRRRNSTRIEP